MSRNFDFQVTINAAMTVDGKIATAKGDSKISSDRDLRRVHKLRSSVDAIIVGISTVIADNPMLSARTSKNKLENPVRVIIDSTARIPLNSKLLKSACKIKTIVAVTKRAPKYKISKIENAGAIVIIAGTGSVDLREVFFFLKRIGIKKILVEGGGELNWSFFSLRMVNQLIVTLAPTIVGGREATTLVEGDGYTKISKAIKMKLIKILKYNSGEVVLFYKVEYYK
ncbi:MAG TPA: 2,5-diamino-6-(ribosylamino)-4(3H)-pyrimidinone 5'-phosphate reductase [Nitrososphaeraceae archaeon]